ncbi:hypothetical protein NQ314_011849 [Rhamnusium bicolor]|uniref:Beta-galactosidase n=1 Tax=Rhamnusium bicolor TaxID=1586634 RepID=A0AAV8XFW5_9CUCU|nr:hypothetical protein NQ314_011849 [Rhamnusium bicolor]
MFDWEIYPMEFYKSWTKRLNLSKKSIFISGWYDFGQGGTDMQEFLDIEKFLKTAQEEDLLAIVRPGPYICAEFEFGGLPSWLLREKNINFRTSDEKFMKHVTRYFNVLLTILASLQFTKGGPIIALQVENEYGSTEDPKGQPPFVPDKLYIAQLRELMLTNNIKELLFTSDSPYAHGDIGSLPSLFQTANFNDKPEQQFDKLKELQNNKPSMAMEFWSGWFSHWSESPYQGNYKNFERVFESILKYPASVNLYMFHGGTSWGFLNGANLKSEFQNSYQPDITSYDYDAPLTEYGDYTAKYFAVKDLIQKYNTVQTKLPDIPKLTKRVAYHTLKIEKYLPYSKIIEQLPYQIDSKELLSMENLPINNNTGQSFGYIIYRKKGITISPKSVLKILGYVYDTVNVYINNELITRNVGDLNSFGHWRNKNSSIELSSSVNYFNATLDLVVENMGRVNFGHLSQLYQFKGLWQGVLLDEREIFDWEIYPMEFKKSWTKSLSDWDNVDSEKGKSFSTGLYKSNLVLNETDDTFLDMRGWNKGIVIVNNFVLGRFWKIGCQQSLYLPAPLLRSGLNEILIFEEFFADDELKFSVVPIYSNNITAIFDKSKTSVLVDVRKQSSFSYRKMTLSITPFVLLVMVYLIAGDTLPTVYEYYTSDGIRSGLSADQSYFTLNGKNFSVYSGAMHYFRVPRAYWRDRLRKIRAAGLNAVETYIAWNLHEPQSGVYDFGHGGSDMEDFLHLEEFLQTAQEEDLLVIVRAGPYICSEYNFGGFPSWLLREKVMGFRTTEPTYIKYVTRYYNQLLPILAKYQFTRGGPIIAFQIENEYGNQEYQTFLPQKEYLEILHQIYVQNGIVELLVTSDSPLSHGDKGTLPGVFLQTANLGASPENQFRRLLELQPNRPLMVMEFWAGWFDFWTETHQTKDSTTTAGTYERILQYPASVNIYMFHGGTNFGFTNGASLNVPELIPRVAYPAVPIEKEIPFDALIGIDAPYVIDSENVVAMEKLDINNNSGQSNGYIVYRKENVDLGPRTVLTIEGHICDTAIVLVNGELVSPILKTSADLNNFGYWRMKDSALVLNSQSLRGATIDIVVEEWGRINGGKIYQYNQTFKGLWQGDVYLNSAKVSDWKIIPLEFKTEWTNNLKAWSDKTANGGPGLYSATLQISDEPRDTYIDMRNWSKGLVVVNGFPLGKYAIIGPQQALYLPAPFLRKGSNTIVVFEHFKAADRLTFVTDQIWSTV